MNVVILLSDSLWRYNFTLTRLNFI